MLHCKRGSLWHCWKRMSPERLIVHILTMASQAWVIIATIINTVLWLWHVACPGLCFSLSHSSSLALWIVQCSESCLWVRNQWNTNFIWSRHLSENGRLLSCSSTIRQLGKCLEEQGLVGVSNAQDFTDCNSYKFGNITAIILFNVEEICG
jgi:hypothetical protein